ncbi:hypothetical protein PoB_003258900 [Plakobranchus ocellatus]|uniref:Uncharacterized protein n=1 Tax=Plakobranchus ocellatus TaxID=259542 RepID=A0AAV4AI06_9GAST|nr:hypothetical protein PoB_003258900 [Plakobranchus ocellatus]
MNLGGVGDTVDRESILRSAGTPLSRVRAPPPVPWSDGGLMISCYSVTFRSRGLLDSNAEIEGRGRFNQSEFANFYTNNEFLAIVVVVFYSLFTIHGAGGYRVSVVSSLI